MNESLSETDWDWVGLFGPGFSWIVVEWAGIMWSDPAPGDFDSQRTAQDLHSALMNAGEQTPWIMVGHSLGGPHIMILIIFTNPKLLDLSL